MNNCSNLIQFDKLEGSSRLTDYFSFLKFINEENYESAKQDAAAEYIGYGYFEGSYEEFREKRNKLTSLLSVVGYTDSENHYRHHILSKTAAEAYADCVRRTNNEQLSVWVDNITETEVAIKIRSGLGGNSAVEFSINDSENKYELLANSDIVVKLDYDPKKDFLVVINSTEKNTGAKMGHSLSIPRSRNLVLKKERKELFGIVGIGAGGYNSFTKNAYCYPHTFVAEPDFYLLQETLEQTNRVVTGVRSLTSFQIDKAPESNNSEIKRLTVSASSLVGSHKHQQSNEELTFKVWQERLYVAEE